MKAHRKFVVFAAVLALASAASAQATRAEQGAGGGATPSSRTADAENPTRRSTGAAEPDAAAPAEDHPYSIFPGERHVMARVMAGSALRLNDAYGAGALAPPYMLVEGHFLFANVGPLRMGPSLGLQLGFDPHGSTQVAVQPGWTAVARVSSLLGVTLRLDIPILITSGPSQHACGTQLGACVNVPPHSPVMAPLNTTTDVGFGFELGVGAAVYLTAGIALTAEINFDLYFGDGFYTYPLLGAGAGILVDYELLP